MLGEVATSVGLLEYFGPDLKIILAIISTTAVIVWRLAALQGMVKQTDQRVKTQNDRIGKLENNVIYKDTAEAYHEQGVESIRRIEKQMDSMLHQLSILRKIK